MDTRRCQQRQLLLSPDEETNQAVLFCVGLAAQRHGIELHGLTAMSNTVCINSRDVRGVDPDFRRDLFSLLGRCMNVIRSRWDAFWSSDEPSVVELLDAEAELDALIYNLTDPVRQHLVDKVHNWPGVSSLRHQLSGKPLTVKRPKKFFRKNGKVPEEVTLHFVPPPRWSHLEPEEWTKLLRERIAAAEKKAAEERRATSRRIVGCKALRRKSPFSFPRSNAPHRNLNPRVKCRDKKKRMAALQRMKTFEARYRAALQRLVDGCRDVLFPAGTWQLARLGIVRCEPAPT